MGDHDLHRQQGSGRGLQAHGLHPQQRPQRRQAAELHDHLQPLRPPRLPGAAERAQVRGEGGDVQGRHADARFSPPASAAPATEAPTTPRATAPPARPSARSTATPSRSSNGNLVLGKHFSVGTVEGTGAEARIQRYPVAYPGVHVDGIESGSIRYRYRGPEHGQVSPPGADREGRPLPARLGRGAQRPRRLHEVVPLPQRPP